MEDDREMARQRWRCPECEREYDSYDADCPYECTSDLEPVEDDDAG